MLLSLFSPAFALVVPVRASYREYVAPGEDATATLATTARIASLTNPATGKAFSFSSQELTANKREASGTGGVTFGTPPKEGTHTWALYFIGSDGQEIGSPELVDVSFDASGNGTVAARASGSRVASLSVSASDANGGATVRVTVQDSGAKAAYVGFTEVGTGGLVTDPDLSVMDSTIYAAFQGLDLDAIVALDTYTLQLDGSVNVADLSVSISGAVEGGTELEWGVDFYTPLSACAKGYGCEDTVAGHAVWAGAIGRVQKKGTVPKVNLSVADRVVESSDASLVLTVTGDVRDLEVSAALDLFLEEGGTFGRDVVALDPGGFGVTAKRAKDDDEDTGMIVDIFIDVDTDYGPAHLPQDNDENQAPPPPWTAMAGEIYDLVVLDSAGREVSSQSCQMEPTAATLAGTSGAGVLVGDCTWTDAGVELRRVQAAIGAKGMVRWTVDMAGPAFARESTVTTCQKGGPCTGTTTTVLGGTLELQRDGEALLTRELSVTETDFDLPFVFDGDVDGATAALALQVYTPTAAIWSVVDGVATAKGATGTISFDLDDLGFVPVGDCGWRGDTVVDASVPESGSYLAIDVGSNAGKGIACRDKGFEFIAN